LLRILAQRRASDAVLLGARHWFQSVCVAQDPAATQSVGPGSFWQCGTGSRASALLRILVQRRASGVGPPGSGKGAGRRCGRRPGFRTPLHRDAPG
jgi:hypothetical protein